MTDIEMRIAFNKKLDLQLEALCPLSRDDEDYQDANCPVLNEGAPECPVRSECAALVEKYNKAG